MLNNASLQAVAAARVDENLGRPLYESYCFSQIPQLLRHVLTGAGGTGLPADVLGGLPRRYDRVLLILVDGFGWCFLEKYGDRLPFLKRFYDQGVVSKLTTQFPSTTAAHVATIHSGLPVGENGIYAWQYYEPLLDDMIAPLPFSFAGDRPRNTLESTGIQGAQLFPTQTLYHQLQPFGVQSFCFQHESYARSPFSSAMCSGATTVPYRTWPEALANLQELAASTPAPAYFNLYFDAVDAISHRYGPDSPQVDAEITAFFTLMEQLFQGVCVNSPDSPFRNTLVLITADHGQTRVYPERTIYLNREGGAAIAPLLQTNAQGKRMVPGGSPRDFFLYIQPQYLDEAYGLLTESLANRARVYRTQTLIEDGYFGPPPLADVFLQRLGNLVVLPHAHETVWWYEKDRFEMKSRGYHGGLSQPEMETVLLAIARD